MAGKKHGCPQGGFKDWWRRNRDRYSMEEKESSLQGERKKITAMTEVEQELKGASSASDSTDGATLKGGPIEKEAKPTEESGSSHLSGLRLFVVMAGLTLVMFLAFLDISIISTVRRMSRLGKMQEVTNCCFPRPSRI